jgi:hypothetical protein
MTVAETDVYREEIERLHDQFVGWFTGEAKRAEFAPIERAMADGFERVGPDGERTDCDAVLEALRRAHGDFDPGTFDIEIRNVEVIRTVADHATVRYEEWQETSDGPTSRISTVLFQTDPETPGGLAWVDLHETWME